MVTDDIARRYNTLSAEDRRTFDRWLKANAAVGLIIAGGWSRWLWPPPIPQGHAMRRLRTTRMSPISSRRKSARSALACGRGRRSRSTKKSFDLAASHGAEDATKLHCGSRRI